jgi:hypothetical protein
MEMHKQGRPRVDKLDTATFSDVANLYFYNTEWLTIHHERVDIGDSVIVIWIII